MKRILITGANKGIGLATVKKLLDSYSDTYVLLGSRDLTRGKQALENLLKGNPEFKDRIYLVLLDVEQDDSVKLAADEVAEEETGCSIGETSKDEKFTVVEVECLGACCNAPMVQINDNYFEDLDEENFRIILNNLKNNKKIQKGSQLGRQTSHPDRKN